MLARRANEQSTILYSYGILRVLLTTQTGETLQLDPAKPSTLVVKIPADQLSTSPNSIPLWYFDETAGYWKEEGVATKQGDRYVGTVTHFTDWNCDVPGESATVIGTVLDCGGQPVMMGQVYVGQSATDLRNSAAIQNSTASGNEKSFSIRVPANIPLFTMLPKPFANVTETGDHMVMVPVPALRPGQVYDAGIITPHPCPTTISGKFLLNSNDEVESVTFEIIEPNNASLSTLPLRIYDPKREFIFSAFPPLTSLSMDIRTTRGIARTITVNTPDEGENIDLGEIQLNTNSIVTVHSVVSCGNTPLYNAVVTFTWSTGSISVQTNTVGVFGVALPRETTVTMKIEHASGSLLKTFMTPSVEVYNLGVSDVCK